MPLLIIFLLTGVAIFAVKAYTDNPDVATAPDPDPAPDVAGDAAPPAAPDAAVNVLGFDMPRLNTWKLPTRAAPYADSIAQAEAANALPQGLLGRLLYEESRFRPDIITGQVKSAVGAVGIAQFMPSTAKDMGVDPLDPGSAIDGAGRYLRRLFDQLGSWDKAIAAYNWGIGNVKRKGLSAAPLETRNYVARITGDINLS